MSEMTQDDTDQGMIAELRNTAERVVADSTDHARTRRLRRTAPGFDTGLVDTFVELGWFGVLVPEEKGGLGLGLADMAVLVRVLEKGLISDPLLPIAVLGTRTLVHAENAAADALLAGVMEGTVRPALALDFDEAIPDVQRVDGRLHGRCEAVAGGAAATHLLVPAREAEGVALYAVPVDAAGVTQAQRWRADETPVARVTLDGVAGATLVAEADRGQAAIEAAIDETRLVAAAGLVGLCEQMLDMTIEYLKVRHQFDAPLGSFQALQHKAVDLYIQKEIAVATAAYGLQLAARGERAAGALRAKGRTSAVANRIGREALHLHGAIGFTDEHDIGLYLKRALTLSAWLGNAAAHRRRYIQMGMA